MYFYWLRFGGWILINYHENCVLIIDISLVIYFDLVTSVTDIQNLRQNLIRLYVGLR